MRELKIESFDKTPIHVTVWDEVENPKAVLQISHGMAEHVRRYDDFASFMNKQGYIVFGDDHRAHGKTETDENRGNHKGDIYSKTVKDLVFLHEWAEKEFGLDALFLGHSYGSFLGQGFAQAGTNTKAIALCGTSHMGGFEMGCVTAIISPLWLVAKNWKPKCVNWFADKLFVYKGDKGDSQWVTRDLQKRQEFLTDPMAKIDMSVNFDFQLMKNLSKLYSGKAKKKLNPKCKMELFCGTADPVGLYGKNAKRLEKFYLKAGIDCKLHLYKDDRHEVLNELNKEKVYQDVLNFFNRIELN